MSFNIIPPLSIFDAQLTASSVAEPDAAQGEIAWVSGANYSAGDVRIRTTTHRKYLALAAITGSTIPPEDDPARWKDVGPTNRYAMFDAERNTASMVNGTSISVTVTPGIRTQALTIFGLSGAEMVTVTGRQGIGGPVVYTRSRNLSTRTTTTWSMYFFGPFTFRESVVLLDLPLISNLSLTVEITRGSAGKLSVETVAFGVPIRIGDAQLGASSDIVDFSKIERDEFGNATLRRRKNVPTLNAQVFVRKADVPTIRRLREQYAARPLIFLGIDDASDAYFDSLSMVGIFKGMPIRVEYQQHVLIDLQAEGL